MAQAKDFLRANCGCGLVFRPLQTGDVPSGAPRPTAACLLGVACLLAGLALASVPATAASNPQTPASLRSLTLEQLGKVEVTTYTKAPTELWDTPAAVYIITSEDIRRSGATTIADALRLAPGVEVGRVSSTTWAVGIRGLQSNFSKSVLVLIDGRNVYTPLFAGVYWNVQDMPLDEIDHIEVIRGPGGTVWGPNAANGVINIITRSSTDTHGVRADTLEGTQDRTIDDLELGGGASSFDYRVYGRGFERLHEYHAHGLNDDTWHEERFGFRADRATDASDLFLEGDLYKGDSPHTVGTTPWDDQISGGNVNFRWERKMTTSSGFYLQGYVERMVRSHSVLNERRNTFDIEFVHHFMAARRNLITYGGGLRWTPYITSPPGELVPAGTTDHVHTAFVQDEIHLNEHLFLTAGTKLQHNNYSGFDLQPSARILWSPQNGQALWAGVTRAVTTPSDLEEHFQLQGVTPTITVQVLGNHSFKSEDVIGYEAGYRRLLGRRLFLDVAGYWNEYSRLQSFSAPMISVAGGHTTITIQYQTRISGSTAGGELAAQAHLLSWWNLNAEYSYLNSDFFASGPTSDISSTGSVRLYEGSSPKHMVTLESKFNLPSQIDFDQTYRFISALPAQTVPAYQTMDLHLQREFGNHVRIEAVGQNLFQNVHYEWGTGDPTQSPIGMYRAAYIRIAFHSAQ